MSDRLTPEQIIGRAQLTDLGEHGYVIVHPDDFEELFDLGAIDGAHHKMWVIDQFARRLHGDGYDQWVTNFCAGDDGPETFLWDEGIAP